MTIEATTNNDQAQQSDGLDAARALSSIGADASASGQDHAEKDESDGETERRRGGVMVNRFDARRFEIPVDVTTDPKKPRTVIHVFEIPEDPEEWKRLLFDRAGSTSYESKQVTATESEPKANTKAPDLKLWRAICKEVSGYKRADGKPASEFQPVTPELADKIINKFSSHATEAIKGLLMEGEEYARYIVVDEDDEDGISLDVSDHMTVREEIGPDDDPQFVLFYSIMPPNDDEREGYEKDAASIRMRTGSTKQHAIIRPRLKPAVESFEGWFITVKGGVIKDPQDAQKRLTFEQAQERELKDHFVDRIWPTRKRGVINAVVNFRKGKLQDSQRQ